LGQNFTVYVQKEDKPDFLNNLFKGMIDLATKFTKVYEPIIPLVYMKSIDKLSIIVKKL